ncbi:MAG: CRISPR-associated helicase Cas3' [Candidatus Bathyarchaeia archaeon]
MLNSVNLTRCWDIVETIVKSRGRIPQKYHYFEEVWDSFQNNQLIFLQAPTGAGKTEAVLAPFIQNLIDNERRWHSVLYVLPTRSLVFNMFYRICKTLNACRQLFKIPRIVIDYDHGGFTQFKAFLEGDITVTTYDTLVYTFYGFRSYGYHLLLSVGKIAGSLVVFDESQLLQDSQWYSLTLLPYHVASLIAFGATVIIITATLPRILTKEIEEALRPFILRQNVKCSSVNVRADPKRDVITRGKLSVSIRDGQLLNNVLEVAKNYEKPMLFIFNTVERAAEAYRYLVKNGYDEVMLLHSRLIDEERKNRETFFEKNPTGHDLIVVATQVVEAGIDYDFKTVATEISPIDSLIQRIGRCARKSDGEALIFRDSKQAVEIYPRITIDKTLRIINESSLAESVRDVLTASNLVNAVYCKEVVENLRKEAHEELSKALSFIKTFSTKIFDLRDLMKEHAQNLLRIGIEIKCVLLPQDIYQKVLINIRCPKDKAFISLPLPLNQIIEVFNKNTLSLSIRTLYKDIEIPALKHKVGNEEFYLSISTSFNSHDQENSSMREQGGTLDIVVYNKLFAAITRHMREGFTSLFIINPSYYSVEKGYHLGLVKLYG